MEASVTNHLTSTQRTLTPCYLLTRSVYYAKILFVFILILLNWWITPFLYLFWIWVWDKKTPRRGGRRVEFLRGLWCWKLWVNYFPVTVHVETGAELNPEQNYLFCSFPHGILSAGAVSTFAMKAGGFHNLFPKHKPHLLTLKQMFLIPFVRDFLLGMGLCNASAKSINWLMGCPEGGNVAVLVVGGAEECYHCRPYNYRLVLKNRKGFVRLALKNGSPLVPVFSFGETETYSQLYNPEGSLVRRFQEFVKNILGIAPIVPIGRFVFLFPFTFIPRRCPLNVVIGNPIHLTKIEDPTEDEVDVLHRRFIQELDSLFEKYKQRFLKNGDKINLTFV